MDNDSQRFIETLGNAMRGGTRRDDLVEELIANGWDAQTAQNACEIARRWRVGQGDEGYQSWFWAILTNKAHKARGVAWLWLVTIACFVAALPLAFGFMENLPSGRYPVVLLALPALVFGVIGAQVLGFGIFHLVARKTEAAGQAQGQDASDS
jgi:hypothetical protein